MRWVHVPIGIAVLSSCGVRGGNVGAGGQHETSTSATMATQSSSSQVASTTTGSASSSTGAIIDPLACLSESTQMSCERKGCRWYSGARFASMACSSATKVYSCAESTDGGYQAITPYYRVEGATTLVIVSAEQALEPLAGFTVCSAGATPECDCVLADPLAFYP